MASVGIGDALDLVAQHVAHHGAQVESGVGVVAEERHALRRQVRGADRQHLPPHKVRHPGEHAESDDVVERAELRAEVHDVHGAQFDVAQPERLDDAAPFLDRVAGQIDAQEFALGQSRAPSR